MVEVGIAAGLMVLVSLVGAAFMLGVHTLYSFGYGAIVIGMAAGVPAGIWYHVALYRRLRRAGPVAASWIWRPTSFHKQLSGDRTGVLVPFAVGAIGFLITIAGCVLVVAGIIRS